MSNSAINTAPNAIYTALRRYPRKIVAYVAGIALMVILPACGVVTINGPAATPIFPTAVPPDNNLPTLSVGVNNLPIATSPPLVLPTVVPANPALDNNWNQVSAGIQWRTLSYKNISNGQTVNVVVTRFDPAKVLFRVQYSQGKGHLMRDWQAGLPGAVAIVNGNYFDANGNAFGLVADNGILYSPLLARADSGVFQVKGGVPKVRSFFLEPYQANEPFDEVVQGDPMFMTIGYVAPQFDPKLDTSANSRTVIAQDKAGRILFIVTAYSTTTFSDMAQWLGVSGLDISSAVNMVGGNSSNLYLATGGSPLFIQTAAALPVVVIVYPR